MGVVDGRKMDGNEAPEFDSIFDSFDSLSNLMTHSATPNVSQSGNPAGNAGLMAATLIELTEVVKVCVV